MAEVLKHPGIWRGTDIRHTEPMVLDCHHAALAAQLPDGGWPVAAVSELVTARAGCGELKVLLPALAALTQAGRHVVLVAPPNIPHAPAWEAAGVDMCRLTWITTANEAEAQWAMEQALRAPGCGAVVGWFNHAMVDRQCRRLQEAAEAGGASGFVLRQGRAETVASPFALRVSVQAAAGGVAVQVLKRRGAPANRPVFLPHDALKQRPYDRHLARHASTQLVGDSAASRPYAYAA